MDSTHSGASSGGADHASPNGSGSATNPKMRKRTKTGCLTCRKRRIKCGEERPTCNNCIKSKRQCEGYNQRVVFKTPIGDWPNHPGVVSTLQYHNSMLPGTRPPGQRDAPPSNQPQDGPLTSIRPRPLTSYDFSNIETGSVPGRDPLNTQQALAGGHRPYPHDPNYQQPLHSPHHQLPTPTNAASHFPQPSPVHAHFQGQYAHEANVGYAEQQRYPQGGHFQQIPVSYDAHVDQKSVSQASQEQLLYQLQRQTTSSSGEQSHYLLHSNAPDQTEGYSQYAEQRTLLHRYGSNPRIPIQQPRINSVDLSQEGPYALPPGVSHTDSAHSSFQPVHIPQHDVNSDVKYVPHHAVLEQPTAVSYTQQNQPQLSLSGFGGDDHVSPTQVLDEAAVEYEDDDYWDVQSDEGLLDGDNDEDEDTIPSRDFSLIRRIHFENTNELAIRRYDTFIYNGILAHYKAEQVANPLKNPKTARVFAHFIHVTGPSLSIFERNPGNTTSIFEESAPPSQQSLWTHILPLKALNHQGLLHAMLALASLHIARLQKASITPSYKHYAYALKRLGRSLGNSKKRLSISTLATSLLLAFYEVMTAEHTKWSTHLVGAAHLLAELDFRSLTQQARRLKAAQIAHERQFPYQNPDMVIDQRQFEQSIREGAMMPDETLVSTIVGKKISYDDFGRVFDEGNMDQDRRKSLPGKLDLRSYETLQDLYWWYARHDAFQSIVSGNPLIMDYRKWPDCPPRAPLGRTDALFGSHDHIILLIGRIADFAVRDRDRKLRQVKASGGQWRPTPGMPGMGGMGGPPPQGQGQNRQPPTPTTPMGPPSHMQGMGPPPGWTGPPPPGWTGGPPPHAPNSQMPPPPSPGFMPPQGQAQKQMPQPPGGPPPANAMPNFYGMAPSRPPISLPSSYANPNHTSHEHSPPTPNTSEPKYSDLPAAYEAALSDWNNISHAHATVTRFLDNMETFAPLTPDLYPPGPGGNMTPFGPALVYRSYSVSIIWALLHLSNILLLRSHPTMPPAAIAAASVCAPATQPYATLIGRIAAGLQIPMTEDQPLTPSLGAALIESTMALFFAGIQYQAPDQREWLVTRLLEINRRTGWASAGVIARSCETSWERAAKSGRGPPYDRRRTPRFGEEDSMNLDADGSGGRGGGWGGGGIIRDPTGRGRVSSSGQDQQNERENWESEERRFVVRYKTALVPWAMNLLATDEDLRVGMERVGIGGEINVAGTDRERGALDRE